MKKSILLASAALAALSFTSCNKEVDMFEPIGSEKATINFNITSDDAVDTRAIQDATTSEWWAKMGENEWAYANTLENKTYTPGDYTIQVGNFKSQADAMPNNEAGAPYYTLTKSVTLVKGTNTVAFACGTAKNGKVNVDWSGTADVAGLTMTSVAASQVATENTSARTYTYTAGGTAYFYAGAEVTFTINYTYNSVAKTITKKITPAAATQYAFNVSANSNGTITTLTITYDDGMANGDATSTTINAATGNEVE
jgi:hypothetical protein